MTDRVIISKACNFSILKAKRHFWQLDPTWNTSIMIKFDRSSSSQKLFGTVRSRANVLFQPCPDGNSTGTAPRHQGRVARRDKDKCRRPFFGLLVIYGPFSQTNGISNELWSIVGDPFGSQKDIINVDYHLSALGDELVRTQQG